MKDYEDLPLRELLRNAIGPVADTGLKRDLWPQMLRRLDESSFRISWFDWALIALVPVWVFCFPQSIPALLYHL